jgi:spore coat polysaccharide biosynthesis protein SpsF
MSSSRIPGKVLKSINGISILEYTIQRLRKHIDEIPIIVCTSNLEIDLSICDLCNKLNVKYFRGSHLNVASRFYEISKAFNFDAFIRVSADSPMIDGTLVSEMINSWEPNLDLLTNIYPRTFPRGQSVEMINKLTYLKFYKEFYEDADFEHVTPYFYRNIHMISHKNIRNSLDHSGLSLAIDYADDFLKFKKFVEKHGIGWIDMNLDELLDEYISR